MMTKTNFEAIASILIPFKERMNKRDFDALTEEFCSYLKAQNYNFSRERFMDKIYGGK